MKRLEGKTCLLTAAAQGIGRATALAMAAEGATVIATDINFEALDGLAPSIQTRALDVMDPKAIQSLASELGAVDVLFNCAGYVANGTILDCEDQDWAFSFDLNVTAMYRMIRAFLPAMAAAGQGSIINMASVVSSLVAAPNRCAYGASKAAVIGLTKSVAADFVTAGIRCNAICPGTVASPSLEERLHATGDYDTAKATFIARQPMNRFAEPEEIAALIVYLASDEAKFTTGVAHVLDGGWANV